MEFISYDKETKTTTLKLTDDELLDLKSVVGAVLSTYSDQDPTILGVDQQRLREIQIDLRNVFEATLPATERARLDSLCR